jgi:hypothetical protein
MGLIYILKNIFFIFYGFVFSASELKLLMFEAVMGGMLQNIIKWIHELKKTQILKKIFIN